MAIYKQGIQKINVINIYPVKFASIVPTKHAQHLFPSCTYASSVPHPDSLTYDRLHYYLYIIYVLLANILLKTLYTIFRSIECAACW